MNGTEAIRCRTESIAFTDYYIHPEYSVYDKDKPLKSADIEWSVGFNVEINVLNDEETSLTVNIIVSLVRKGDGVKIAGLTAKSSYIVFNPLSFSNKYFVLSYVIDQTIGHAQGGWRKKNRNVRVFQLIPQAYGKAEAMELLLKKKLYEEWI